MQLFYDLPKDKIRNVIEIALRENSDHDINSILDSINSKSETKLSTLDGIALYSEEDLPSLRKAIADSAKNKSWFKNIPAGEALGNYLFHDILQEMMTTKFYKTFERIKSWVINEQ